MARAVWTGEVAFGKVRIPVRLEGVVQDKGIHAHRVHREDLGRLAMKRFCTKCGREIDWNDTASAVEVGNREVVDFDPDELKDLRAERGYEIVLSGFLDPGAVDPVYYDRAYTLVPIGKQPRAFELLASALRESHTIAVTRANFSGKSRPAVVRPRGADLVLHTLHFGEEVRDARLRPEPQLRPSARETTLATRLVERMRFNFDPASTEDPYRKAVEQRAIGRTARPIDEEAARRRVLEQDAEVRDLMSALELSLREGQGAQRGEQRARRAAHEVRRPASRGQPRSNKGEDDGGRETSRDS